MDLTTKTKEELIEYINNLTSNLEVSNSKIDDMKLELEKANVKLNWYEEQFRLYQRNLFGSKSEKIDHNQLSLFNEVEKESDLTLEEPVLEEEIKDDSNNKKTRKPKRSREVIYKDLPIERHEHHLENNICPQCHSQLH